MVTVAVCYCSKLPCGDARRSVKGPVARGAHHIAFDMHAMFSYHMLVSVVHVPASVIRSVSGVLLEMY